jgi:hypothetical protein
MDISDISATFQAELDRDPIMHFVSIRTKLERSMLRQRYIIFPMYNALPIVKIGSLVQILLTTLLFCTSPRFVSSRTKFGRSALWCFESGRFPRVYMALSVVKTGSIFHKQLKKYNQDQLLIGMP